MKVCAAILIFVSLAVPALTVPALAQQGISKMGGGGVNKEAADKAEMEKKKESAEIEKAYKNTIKRIPEQASKRDPWGNVR
jgi:hypothetical protein